MSDTAKTPRMSEKVKKVLSGVAPFKKEMEELGVDVKVSIEVSLYQPKPKGEGVGPRQRR